MQGECVSTPHIRRTQREPPIVLRVSCLLNGMFVFVLFIKNIFTKERDFFLKISVLDKVSKPHAYVFSKYNEKIRAS